MYSRSIFCGIKKIIFQLNYVNDIATQVAMQKNARRCMFYRLVAFASIFHCISLLVFGGIFDRFFFLLCFTHNNNNIDIISMVIRRTKQKSNKINRIYKTYHQKIPDSVSFNLSLFRFSSDIVSSLNVCASQPLFMLAWTANNLK